MGHPRLQDSLRGHRRLPRRTRAVKRQSGQGLPVRRGAGRHLRVRQPGYERILEVRRLIAKRVGAKAASHCFTDHTPPRPVAPALGIPQRDRGTGRPTKKDRRDMEKLLGER